MVHQLSVWIGSWNVGNSVPCALHEWLPVSGDYDIVVVGTQVYTVTKNFAND